MGREPQDKEPGQTVVLAEEVAEVSNHEASLHHSKRLANFFEVVLKHVKYPGLVLCLHSKGSNEFLYIHCPEGRCNVSGKTLPWNSRKWYLSPHMTDSEIVQTAFKAIITALEHEARERFTYKGVAVCDPHLDLDAVAVARRSVRPSAD